MSVSLRNCCASAVGAGGACGKQGRDVSGVPGLRALALEEVDNLAIQSGSRMGFWQPSQRKTAMGTPQMRWRLMHQSGRVAIMLVMRSLPQAGSQTTLSISSMASWRKVVSRAVGALDRRFEADEPLLGGAEDDGMVAAPAVRVGVLERRAGQQGSALFEHGDDDGIGGTDLHAVEGGRGGWGQASGSTWMWPAASTRQVGSRP